MAEAQIPPRISPIPTPHRSQSPGLPGPPIYTGSRRHTGQSGSSSPCSPHSPHSPHSRTSRNSRSGAAKEVVGTFSLALKPRSPRGPRSPASAAAAGARPRTPTRTAARSPAHRRRHPRGQVLSPLWCCGWVLRRTLRAGEPREEAMRKRRLVPTLAFLLTPLLVYSFGTIDQFGSWQDAGGGDARPGGPGAGEPPTMGWVASWLGTATMITFLVYVLVSKRLSESVAELTLFAMLVAIVLGDWGSANRGDGEVWNWSIIVMDGLLVIAARKNITHGCVIFMSLWLILRSEEDSFGLLGMWRFPYDSGKVRPARPTVNHLCIFLFHRVFPFCIDFWFTRHFSSEMQRQAAQMEKAIQVASQATEHLSRYETDRARLLIASNDSATLPPELRATLGILVENLCKFQPYLPQSVLAGLAPTDRIGPNDNDGSMGFVRMIDDTFAEKERATPLVRCVTSGTTKDTGESQSDGDGSVPAASRSQSDILRSGTGMEKDVVRQVSWQRDTSMSTSRTLSVTQSLTPSMSQLSPVSRSPKERMFAVTRKWGQGAGVQLTQKLESKRATLVVGNLREYLSVVRGNSAASVHAFHAKVCAGMMASAARHTALTDGISADRFHASLNGARRAVGHAAAGVRLAWGLAASGGCADAAELAPFAVRSQTGSRAEPLTGAAGACTGGMLCGDIGCAGLLRYSFIGEAAAWVHALERLATRWGAAAAANGGAKADADTAFGFRLRSAAVMAKPSHMDKRPQWVWEVTARLLEQETGEWMYQIANQEAGDEWRHLNRALAALYSGDCDAAVRHAAEGATGLRAGGGAAVRPPAMLQALYDDVRNRAARRPGLCHDLLQEAYLTATGDTLGSKQNSENTAGRQPTGSTQMTTSPPDSTTASINQSTTGNPRGRTTTVQILRAKSECGSSQCTANQFTDMLGRPATSFGNHLPMPAPSRGGTDALGKPATSFGHNRPMPTPSRGETDISLLSYNTKTL